MKTVLSRKYYHNKLWKITESIQPQVYDFRFTGEAQLKPSKEAELFTYLKVYEKKIPDNGYQFIRLVRGER